MNLPPAGADGAESCQEMGLRPALFPRGCDGQESWGAHTRQPHTMGAVCTPSYRPTLTVEALIVSYQTRDLLHQTITTLLEHLPDPSVARLSVAVFDNASDDGSADMVASEFPAVRLVRSEHNVGFAAANNALARTSQAAYLLLLNSDVIVVEDLVAPLLAALDGDPRAVIVGPRLTGRGDTRQHSSQDFPTLRFELARVLHQTRIAARARPILDTTKIIAETRQHGLIDSREPRRTSFLWATCWLIMRQEVVQHGLFDERYGTYDEDLDFCWRLARRGGTAVYVPGVRLVHLGGSSSNTKTKTAMTRRGRTRYYADHHGRGSEVLYRFAIGALVELKRLKRG
jgi:N-acetylglucosaminyl-diphospho-decaprenol L-rhamnosyltransferase